MQLKKFYPHIISSILFIAVFYSGCAPSSYSVRYKNSTGLKTYEDSLNVGLIRDDTDDLIYYSQVQDTSAEFQDWEYGDEEGSYEGANISISSVLNRLNVSLNPADSMLFNNTPRERMLIEIIKYMDTPYKYGGNSQSGIDCSAFTQNVFSNCFGISLLRSAREQFTQGFPVREKGNLVFGDLVFFNTRRAVRPGHVGIYIGDNLFAHASSSKGVIVSSLEHKYYSKRFMGGRRLNETFSKN